MHTTHTQGTKSSVLVLLTWSLQSLTNLIRQWVSSTCASILSPWQPSCLGSIANACTVDTMHTHTNTHTHLGYADINSLPCWYAIMVGHATSQNKVAKAIPNEIAISRPYFLSFRCGQEGYYHYQLLWISLFFGKILTTWHDSMHSFMSRVRSFNILAVYYIF